MNILVNAAQAIAAGEITIKTWKEATEVRITISDTGVGIPPEHCGRFSTRASQPKASESAPAGLSICYKIIQDHRGRIASEQSAHGTTFTITSSV